MFQSKKTSILMGVVVFAIAGQGICGEADWPQWRGPNRDGRVPAFQAPESWPASLEKKWEVVVGSGAATPAHVEGRLYLHTRQGDEETVVCLDGETGKEIWVNRYPSPPVTGPASRHPGPRSSPAVSQGKVVTLGVAGIVSCLEAASGKVLWRNDSFKGVPRFFTAMSPIIVDDVAVLQLGGPDAGVIVAFDLATGGIKWQWEGEAPAYASPVLCTVEGVTQIVTFTNESLLGISADSGKVLWKKPFPASGRSYNAATPLVDGHIVYYAGAGRGSHAVKVVTNQDGFAVEELWSNPAVAPQYNSPVLVGGKLFGLSERGNFYCLDARSGQTVWVDETRYSAFGSLLVAGPFLVAMTENSGLIVFPPSEEGLRPVAQYKLSGDPVYATPVLVGNRIYVKGASTLSLWVIP